MVTSMVWRPEELRFELREIAGNLWQKVLIRDESVQCQAILRLP
jgi:hypothetical protein